MSESIPCDSVANVLAFLAAGRKHILDGIDDRLVAGAAAVVSGQVLADLVARGAGETKHEIMSGHQHAGRAESALERVAPMEGFLQLRELAGVGQSFDGIDSAPIRLYGKHQATAHDLAVDADRAGAAHAMLAGGVRSSETQLLAEEVDEMLACGYSARYHRAVDRQGRLDSRVHTSGRQCRERTAREDAGEVQLRGRR